MKKLKINSFNDILHGVNFYTAIVFLGLFIHNLITQRNLILLLIYLTIALFLLLDSLFQFRKTQHELSLDEQQRVIEMIQEEEKPETVIEWIRIQKGVSTKEAKKFI